MITKEIVNIFIERLELTLSKTLNLWGYDNLDHFVDSVTPAQKTIEKTKLLAHFYEQIFKDVLKEKGFQIDEISGKGYDIIINDKKYEMKLTLSSGNSWTGNCASTVKVDDLILIKLNFDKDNKVNELFFALLEAKNSTWKGNDKTNNSFSNLNIMIEDLENLEVIYGEVRKNRKYLKIIKENISYSHGKQLSLLI